MNDVELQQEIQKVLELMNIHYKEISVHHDSDLHITLVNMRTTQDTELFMENNKSLLRDFSFVIKQVLKKQFHYHKDIIFDVNHTERDFINFTKEKASLALQRVQFFEKPYEFGYLNSYERMLVHSYLKKYKEVITESQGEGSERRLVVKKS